MGDIAMNELTQTKRLTPRHIMVVVAACGMLGAMSSISNVAGVFFTPMATALNVGRGSVSLTTTINGMVSACVGLFIPKVLRSDNFKKLVLLAMVLMVGSTLFISTVSSLPLLYLACVVRGMSAGMVHFVTTTILLSNWYHEKLALVTSIAMGFTGVGGAVLSPILTAIIGRGGWRAGMIGLAAFMALFLAPALLLPITLKPGDQGLEPYGRKEEKTETKTVSGERIPIDWLTAGLVIAAASMASMVTSMAQHYPGTVSSYGLAAAVGSAMISAAMIVNTCGKLLYGTIVDRLSNRRTVPLFGAVTVASLLVILTARSAPLLIAASASYGLCYTLCTVACVMTTKEIFGLENYATVYPKVSMGTTIGNAFAAFYIGHLYDVTGSYSPALIMEICFEIAVVVLISIAYKRGSKAR